MEIDLGDVFFAQVAMEDSVVLIGCRYDLGDSERAVAKANVARRWERAAAPAAFQFVMNLHRLHMAATLALVLPVSKTAQWSQLIPLRRSKLSSGSIKASCES